MKQLQLFQEIDTSNIPDRNISILHGFASKEELIRDLETWQEIERQKELEEEEELQRWFDMEMELNRQADEEFRSEMNLYMDEVFENINPGVFKVFDREGLAILQNSK